MHRILINLIRIWLIIVAVLVLCISVAANNLLADPSFESFTAGTTWGDGIRSQGVWRFYSLSGSGGSLQAVSPGRTGDIAIKLIKTGYAADSAIGRERIGFNAALPNTAYRCWFWGKSESGSNVEMILSAWNSDHQFLGKQLQETNFVGTEYKKYTAEWVTPADTAYIALTVRLNKTGEVTIDDLGITDQITDYSPVITYPSNEVVDSFKPIIAWMGPAHTAYQVLIQSGETTIWDSGTVESSAFTATSTVSLSYNTAYTTKVRVRTSRGWTDFSPVSSFTTPLKPIIKITNPTQGDFVCGPTIWTNWKIEVPSSFTSQWISYDGGAYTNVYGTFRALGNTLSDGMHTVSLKLIADGHTVIDTVRFYIRSNPRPTGTVYFYDLTWTNTLDRKTHYDIVHAVSALQGLVNRKGPRLFVKIRAQDDSWYSIFRNSSSGNTGYLSKMTSVILPTGINNLATVFNTFKDDYKGALIWDENVYATANVAGTVAGAEDLIPIRYCTDAGSVYVTLVNNGPKIPVSISLVNRFTGTGNIWQTQIPSSGSKKNDAYIGVNQH